MSDQAPTGPRLSDSAIQYQREVLAGLSPDSPHAVMIRSTLETALKASGQDAPPAADERTPAQQYHDRSRGVVPGALPSHLADLLASATEAADPTATEAAVTSMGRSYPETLANAQAALAHGKRADIDP